MAQPARGFGDAEGVEFLASGMYRLSEQVGVDGLAGLDFNGLGLVVGVGVGHAGDLQKLGLHRRVAVAAHKAFGLDDVLHGVVLSIKGVMPRVYRGACQRCMPRKRRGRIVAYSRVRTPRCYSLALNPRKRRALPTTHSDERLIAAAPNMGESCHPKMGKKTPAASGMPREL